MVVYKIMVSFKQWHLRFMKCGQKLIYAHCIKFRHMEVYMINVAHIPFFKDPEDTDSLKTAHFV